MPGPAGEQIGYPLTTGWVSEPTSLITITGLQHEHWTQIQSGWMVPSTRPLRPAQIAAARDLAARTGLVIEFRNTQASLAAIRTVAAAAGALIAIGVLAVAVGLIRRAHVRSRASGTHLTRHDRHSFSWRSRRRDDRN